jgi:DNA-binding response OmpR family regulator
MAKILIIEDNLEEAEVLDGLLKSEGHTVDLVHNGEDALQLLKLYPYDLLIVDWELPGMAGPEISRQYRNLSGHSPILMLTGRSDATSKAAGLDFGADDYLTKPYEFIELNARIRSLLRRPPVFVGQVLRAEGLEFDVEKRVVQLGGKTIDLTPRESAVLEFLLRHPDRVFGSKALLNAVWPLESAMSEDTVRSCMRTLRKKLDAAGGADIITTMQTGGYMIKTKEATP